MYDTSYRIPMIIKPAGEVSPHLDQAKSLLLLINGESVSIGREYVHAQFTAHFTDFHQRMIRTRTHKFIFNSPAEGELYDLEKDPHEMKNLIDNPKYDQSKKNSLKCLSRK